VVDLLNTTGDDLSHGKGVTLAARSPGEPVSERRVRLLPLLGGMVRPLRTGLSTLACCGYVPRAGSVLTVLTTTLAAPTALALTLALRPFARCA
jgi:hypothetical protein